MSAVSSPLASNQGQFHLEQAVLSSSRVLLPSKGNKIKWGKFALISIEAIFDRGSWQFPCRSIAICLIRSWSFSLCDYLTLSLSHIVSLNLSLLLSFISLVCYFPENLCRWLFLFYYVVHSVLSFFLVPFLLRTLCTSPFPMLAFITLSRWPCIFVHFSL